MGLVTIVIDCSEFSAVLEIHHSHNNATRYLVRTQEVFGMLLPEEDSGDGLGNLHEIVPRDYKLVYEWKYGHSRDTDGHSDREPASTFELHNASEEYSKYMSELTKYTPSSSHWYNWYSDLQTISYRRWSIFDVALGNWASGFVKPLKQQLEAARFCEHTVIDPTPHYRFLRMNDARDILRANLALNQKGLGRYQELFSQDFPVDLPVMVFQVATRETLEATRHDMWRHLWLSHRCRVGIIFIVNSFYDQHTKPFKLSMEIWSHDPSNLKGPEYPYLFDDCPLPVNHSPSQHFSVDNQLGRDLSGFHESNSKHPFEWDTDGFPTFSPAKNLPGIIMRHKKEIIVIDETQEETDLLKYVTFWVTDFIPLCRARSSQDVTIKSVQISLDSLRECVRQEWELNRNPEQPDERDWENTIRWQRLYRPSLAST